MISCTWVQWMAHTGGRHSVDGAHRGQAFSGWRTQEAGIHFFFFFFFFLFLDGVPANTVWRKLLYSGFKTCFGRSTQGAEIRYQNTSQIQILLASHVEKQGRDDRLDRLTCEARVARAVAAIRRLMVSGWSLCLPLPTR